MEGWTTKKGRRKVKGINVLIFNNKHCISERFWIKDRGHILNIKYSHKGALVKQVQKRFNPDEIRATEISSRLNKCKKGLTGQVGQAGQAETLRGRKEGVGDQRSKEEGIWPKGRTKLNC